MYMYSAAAMVITLAIGAFTFKNRRITLSSIYKVGKNEQREAAP